MLAALLLTTAIFANGQTTHLWITEAARTHITDEALSEVLTTNSDALRVGTMFPDGGYAVDHPYGETAHWEGFQDLLRDHIRASWPDPTDTDAGATVAFYLGLASHGMADQLFDATYMERSKVYDAEAWTTDASLDTSSDVVWASLTSPQEVPERWLPEELPELFAAAGVEVDADTLDAGQALLELAVMGVGALSASEDSVALHTENFPWGCAHLDDPMVPGRPAHEAEVVAAYWQVLWDELRGEEEALSLLATIPDDGGADHPETAGDIESRIGLVFSRGLMDGDVTDGTIVVSADGAEIAVTSDLFYRDHSHVVNVSPDAGWAAEAIHAVTVDPALRGSDGRAAAQRLGFSFSTAPPVDTPEADTAGADTASAGAEVGRCGCGGGAAGLLLLGLGWRRRFGTG